MLFGSISSPSGGAKPTAIQMNGVTGECKFFLGDHWIYVGKTYLVLTQHGPAPQLPDFDLFFDERRYLEDGSDIWRQWGPTVN